MKLRRVYPLIIGFVIVPAALMLTVGILILVLGSAAKDILFGVLIVALVATTLIGVVATLLVLYREAYLSKLQTEFVNKVSHDLRTPLTSIRMFVETLQMGRLPDPARQQEALGIIADETTRLSNLIGRLLDWARMEAGKRFYDLKFERPEAVVEAALNAFEPQLVFQPAEVTCEIEPMLPDIFADKNALSEALLNLLQNAHKYTGINKKITVSARRRGPTVQISVSDNGPGITRTDQKRIFDKFYRAKDPLDRTIEGSGLGLAIVQHIVVAHSARISVASEVGRGTTFTVTLPIGERR